MDFVTIFDVGSWGVSFPVTDNLTSIHKIGLSLRARSACMRLQLRNIGDLLRTTPAQLLQTKNTGRITVGEIATKLSNLGYCW